MNYKTYITFIIFLITFSPIMVDAVIPPDFIIQIGLTLAQLFAVIGIFFGTLTGLVKNIVSFIKTKNMNKIFNIIFLCIIFFSFLYYHYSSRKKINELHSVIVQLQDVQQDIGEDYTDLFNKYQNSNNQILDLKNENLINKKLVNDIETPLAISNYEFSKILSIQPSTSYVILDGRESAEREVGFLPNSVHYRFADILSGAWRNLSKENMIYVYCTQGRRGKGLTEFLNEHGLNARYLEGGSESWFHYGGVWSGEIFLLSQFQEEQHRKLLSTYEVNKNIKKGAFVIDVRGPDKFNTWHIDDSILLSTINTASSELDKKYNQIPKASDIIITCDTYSNCFDAKITGIELEKRGHTLLGRYTKVWDYKYTYDY